MKVKNLIYSLLGALMGAPQRLQASSPFPFVSLHVPISSSFLPLPVGLSAALCLAVI